MMEQDDTIIRQSIPALPAGAARIGREGDVKRSFDSQKKNPIRLFLGEPLILRIEFQTHIDDALVVCHTNFNHKDHSWRQLQMKEKTDGVYELKAVSSNCGEFAFRIKYSFDGGKSWIWDRASLMHVHVDPPRMKAVRSYTMIPTALGTTDKWTAHLDHVRRMGFNMVHLLPVTRMGGSASPYSAADLFSMDPMFVPKKSRKTDVDGLETFEKFVYAAREHEISLCIDLVLNHVAQDSEIARSAPDWIMPDKTEQDGFQRSGCWHMDQWLKWGDLVKIYYDHPDDDTRKAIWEYMRDYALFWAYYADFTGGMVRLDNLHNSDEDFISYLLDELRIAYPRLIIHAEFFSDSNTLLKRARDWDLNLFLANPWEYPYAENLRDYLKHCHEIGSRVPQYTPVTTHDTGAPASLFGSPLAAIPRYFITALFSTGQTGLVQGVEYAVPEKVPFIGRNLSFPYKLNETITEMITRINAILAQHDFLHHAGNLRFIDGNHGAIVGGFRAASEKDDAGLGLLLFANLDIRNDHFLDVDLRRLTGTSTCRLQDVIYSVAPFDAGEKFRVSLPPCGVAVYHLLPDSSDPANATAG
jgi:hypothetical protein